MDPSFCGGELAPSTCTKVPAALGHHCRQWRWQGTLIMETFDCRNPPENSWGRPGAVDHPLRTTVLGHRTESSQGRILCLSPLSDSLRSRCGTRQEVAVWVWPEARGLPAPPVTPLCLWHGHLAALPTGSRPGLGRPLPTPQGKSEDTLLCSRAFGLSRLDRADLLPRTSGQAALSPRRPACCSRRPRQQSQHRRANPISRLCFPSRPAMPGLIRNQGS